MRVTIYGTPSLASAAESAWIYLGEDFESHARLQSRLGAESEIPSGPLVNAVVDRHRDALLNFDGSVRIRSLRTWAATDLAERNQYTSSFLFACCSALVIDELVRSREDPLLVVVDDPLLAHRLAEVAAAAGAAVELSPAKGSRRRLLVRGAVYRGLFVLGQFRVRHSLPQRDPAATLRGVNVLLVTWASPDTFDANATLDQETFFGTLPKELKKRGRHVGYLAIPADWVDPFERIVENARSAKDPVVIPEDLLQKRDLLLVVARSLVPPVRIRRLEVGGVDLTGILRDERLREWAKMRELWALRFFHVGRRLARTTGVRVVVHPYENQPWEKELRLGLHSGRRSPDVVAWQHTPVSERWFAFFPSRRDLAGRLAPDRFVTIGERWRRLFEAHGYRPDSLLVHAPLRYARLANGVRRPPQPAQPTALVAASIGWSDSLELVAKAIDALTPEMEIRVLVKLHPKMGGTTDSFIKALDQARDRPLPGSVEFATGSVTDALAEASVVLYNATSVSYEALGAGVPLVYVSSDFWFDADPIPGDSTFHRRARTPAEIREAVLDALREGVDEEAVAAMLRDAFARESDRLPAELGG